ncbi:MAG: ferritin [Chloroflexi bacterium]|nr:ferritin [Chloroflexota bacterium]
MLSKTMQDALNEQINKEYFSAYLYLSMSAYFESVNLPGSAKWMRAQHGEEQEHALKFFDYVNDRGGRVTLKAIEQPQVEFKSPVATWEMVLEHEKKVTASIHKLYEIALAEKDYATQSLLKWFIDEQVEEEKNATQMVERFKQAGEHPSTLLLLDGHFTKHGE